MYIKRKKQWDRLNGRATDEKVYMERRRFIKEMAGYGLTAGFFLSGVGGFIDPQTLFAMGKSPPPAKPQQTPTSGLYPAKTNKIYTLDRPLTDENVAATYNNFFEFSAKKNVWKYVEGFRTRPWTVEVTGLVKRPKVFDIDELIRKMTLEERLYRLRCVEAWAMAVPWTGFPMRDLIRLVEPLSSARYVRFQSLYDRAVFREQRLRFWLPWPYEEGLTMEEAANELTIIATGIYGHELPGQHGSPIRLIVPWKYGYKSIKSIVRIEFTDRKPQTFWNTLAPGEYGFVSNVNPEVDHPRWSQKTERILGTGERRKTVKYNGYGEFVAGLYM